MSKAVIYYYTAQERMALDGKLPGRRTARDDEPEKEFNPLTLNGDADGVMLDRDTVKEMLDHHAKGVAMYSKILADMKEPDGDAEGEDLAPGPGGVVSAGMPKIGARDSRPRLSFDERWPEASGRPHHPTALPRG
jgi:hypothetical protein